MSRESRSAPGPRGRAGEGDRDEGPGERTSPSPAIPGLWGRRGRRQRESQGAGRGELGTGPGEVSGQREERAVSESFSKHNQALRTLPETNVSSVTLTTSPANPQLHFSLHPPIHPFSTNDGGHSSRRWRSGIARGQNLPSRSACSGPWAAPSGPWASSAGSLFHT